jgi:hypothetical protein
MAHHLIADETTNPIPRCPHCDAEQAAIGLFNWAAGMWMILAIYCSECHKILHLQALPVATQEIEGQIVKPS